MKIGSITVMSGAAGVRTAKSQVMADGRFVDLPTERLGDVRLRITKQQRYVALTRLNEWWVGPSFGGDDLAGLGPSVFLLVERTDGRYVLVLPLIDGGLLAEVMGDHEGLGVQVTGGPAKHGEGAARLLLVSVGDDPHALIAESMRAVAAELRTFRLREDKRLPEFVEMFGWCTWDAFYQQVDERKVTRGMNTWEKGGLIPPLVLIDDGWQDSVSHKLNSFRSHPEKFPKGMGPLAAKLHERYGVACVGVWHTLQGYWNGVGANSELAGEYDVKPTLQDGIPWSEDKRQSAALVDPRDIHRFYQDWHAELRRQGIDMVKVDNQSSTLRYAGDVMPAVETARAYQRALQGGAQTHLEGNVLHCMCHSLDVAYHMSSSSAFRNSDDFWPKRPESHGRHVHANAMNNLWTGRFALPDWDMFQSHHEAGAFHAAARSISGGPIYVSDKPGKQDFTLLRKLCTTGGRVLRCPAPAVPAADCLFVDCYREEKLLKIANRNGAIGVLGLFHCCWREAEAERRPIAEHFTATDVPGLDGGRFAAYLHHADELHVMTSRATHELELPPMGCELVTLSPIVHGIAPLGLLDKFNGSAAIEEAGFREDGAFAARLRDGGRIGFYCEHEPQRVLVNARERKGRYDADSGLLLVTPKEGEAVEVVVS